MKMKTQYIKVASYEAKKGEVKKGMFAYSEALDVKKAEEKGRRKGNKLQRSELKNALNL